MTGRAPLGIRGSTWLLLLLAVVSIGGTHLCLTQCCHVPAQQTALAESQHMLSLQRPYSGDSWLPMLQGLVQARAGKRGALYDELFFKQHVKFQYPPSSLFAVYPLLSTKLGRWLQEHDLTWQRLLDGISLGFVGLTALCCAGIFRRSARQLAPTAMPSLSDQLLCGGCVVALTLTFYPIVRAYNLGQIQAWINGLMAMLVWCWLRGNKRVGGVLAGLACLIKPQYGLLLLWGAYRKEWRFAGALATTCAVGFGLSIAVFGFQNHLGYLQVLSYISRHGESFHPNQSVNGLLNRLLFNGNNLDWDGNAFAPYHSLVHGGTIASSLLMLAGAFLWRMPTAKKGSPLDLGILILTATMASPVAWEHHYGILMPIYALLLPAVLAGLHGTWQRLPNLPSGGDSDMVSAGLVLLSYPLASSLLTITNRFADTGWNVLQSYLLLGGLLVLAALYRMQPVPSGASETFALGDKKVRRDAASAPNEPHSLSADSARSDVEQDRVRGRS